MCNSTYFGLEHSFQATKSLRVQNSPSIKLQKYIAFIYKFFLFKSKLLLKLLMVQNSLLLSGLQLFSINGNPICCLVSIY